VYQDAEIVVRDTPFENLLETANEDGCTEREFRSHDESRQLPPLNPTPSLLLSVLEPSVMMPSEPCQGAFFIAAAAILVMLDASTNFKMYEVCE
jgi:hypothetical protein